MKQMIADATSSPYEEVNIRSRDGINLHARYYHNRDGAPVEIQIHGYRGHPLRDFCGGIRDSKARGHNLILVDQRAHGGSGGKAISFGIKERYDCLDWINYATERFGEDTPIILIGISMGASTVLMASGLSLPDSVKVIMADCPFSSPEAIIRKVIKDMKLPHRIAFPFVRVGGMIFGGFDVCSASALDAVKSSKTPTLLIHGESDSFVPFEMGKALYDNLGSEKKAFLPVAGADHGTSYFLDMERYLGVVEEFIFSTLERKDDEA